MILKTATRWYQASYQWLLSLIVKPCFFLSAEDQRDESDAPRDRAATWSESGQQPLSTAFKPPPERKVTPPATEASTDSSVYITGYSGTPGAAALERKLTLEERIDMAFRTSASLLKEILFDFAHYLSRILVGSHGQDLIADGLGSLKSEDSTVELIMLLCSQEWQNSLQKHAGAAFMDLINEGRLISHSTRERIVMTASEALDILKDKEEVEQTRHSTFQKVVTDTMALYSDEYKMYDQFFKAKKKRNFAVAEHLLEKVTDSLFVALFLSTLSPGPLVILLEMDHDLTK